MMDKSTAREVEKNLIKMIIANRLEEKAKEMQLKLPFVEGDDIKC